MNTAFYYVPAWRRRQQSARQEPEAVAESVLARPALLTEAAGGGPAQEPARAAGRTVGFWAIPDQGDGDYLKLRIAAEYGDVPGFDPRAPWPVAAVARNRRILLPSFPWLERHLDGWETPEGAERLASVLRRRGWRFAAVRGTVLHWGGKPGDRLLAAVVDELAGGRVHRPASVRLDVSRVTQLKFLRPDGRVSQTVDRDRMMALGARGAEAEEGTVEERMRRAVASAEPWRALALLLRSVSETGELDRIDVRLLARVLAPDAVRRDMRKALDDTGDAGMVRLRGTVLHFLGLADRAGLRPSGEYPPELRVPVRESLEERSYFELWNLTRENGGYKYGGLRRIGGRWVYDALVRGRSTNGARFVLTNPPRPYRDEDGRIVLRFQYQSRPSRSTTGMMQVGYVKFKDHEAFTRAASRNLAAALKHGDVEVVCSCPDNRFRWQWVLANDGSAPQPMGVANTPPDQTNPRRLLSMCKHLSAVSPFMLTRPTGAFDRDLRRILKLSRDAATDPAPDGGPQTLRRGAELDTAADAPEPDTEPAVEPPGDDMPEMGR